MKYMDMHCDTLMVLAGPDAPGDLYENQFSVDIRRMKNGSCAAQFFAVFMLPEKSPRWEKLGHIGDEAYIQLLYQTLFNNIEKYGDSIGFAKNLEDLKKNEAAGKVSAFLTLEDGRAVNGQMENLERYYQMGFRLISLTWNYANCFGAPNSADPIVMNTGLTDFGKEAVVRMNELGMVVDVSHLSDGGFWDVCKLSQKPFVASHSNCRAISPHRRNLTDEMIRALGEKGGVAGINFGPDFLNPDPSNRESTVKQMSQHIQRMRNLGGIDCVGLGSDFDGIRGNLQVSGSDKMGLVFDQLHWDGFTDDEIEKVAYKNVQRVIGEVMK